MDKKVILVLAPHPDDGEFSCGASLNKFCKEGKEVWYVAFSPCDKSMPEGTPINGLYQELAKATKIIGIPEERVITLQFPVREFPAYRQEILEELIRLRKRINPDMVLLPNGADVHQDHHTIYQEGVRAFKFSSIVGYELPWNSLSFRSNFHIKVEKEHLDAKFESLQEYSTQKGRPYLNFTFLEGLARTRGIQVGSEFAEAFELIRWIV